MTFLLIVLGEARWIFVCVTVRGRWKVVAERLGLRGSEIEFLDERYPNPSQATLEFVAHRYGLNVDDLYDLLTECEMPVLADILWPEVCVTVLLGASRRPSFVHYLLFCGFYICVFPSQWCKKRCYLLRCPCCQVPIQSLPMKEHHCECS